MQGPRRRFHLRQAWPKRPQLPRRLRPCRVEYVLGDAVRDTHTMWVYLETWLVQDGSLPWLQRGQRLREVGLVAACWSVGPASGPDGVVYEEGLDPDGESSQHCRVTGTV